MHLDLLGWAAGAELCPALATLLLALPPSHAWPCAAHPRGIPSRCRQPLISTRAAPLGVGAEGEEQPHGTVPGQGGAAQCLLPPPVPIPPQHCRWGMPVLGCRSAVQFHCSTLSSILWGRDMALTPVSICLGLSPNKGTSPGSVLGGTDPPGAARIYFGTLSTTQGGSQPHRHWQVPLMPRGSPMPVVGVCMPRDRACLVLCQHGEGDLWGRAPPRASQWGTSSLPARLLMGPCAGQSHVSTHALTNPVSESIC